MKVDENKDLVKCGSRLLIISVFKDLDESSSSVASQVYTLLKYGKCFLSDSSDQLLGPTGMGGGDMAHFSFSFSFFN